MGLPNFIKNPCRLAKVATCIMTAKVKSILLYSDHKSITPPCIPTSIDEQQINTHQTKLSTANTVA